MKSVLFLCTGNSARSVLAEAYLNHAGGGRFKAYSAGSQPAGKVNPLALQLLSAKGIRTAGFRSKSWNEFASMPLDLIFTVCDNAAAETCPVWPGKPATAHWGVPDPAAVQGSDAEKRAAFERAYVALSRRIERLIALPVETLDRQTLQKKLDEIGSG